MHIASQAGHPETTLVFLKKGVPLHMPNKVNMAHPLLKVKHNIRYNDAFSLRHAPRFNPIIFCGTTQKSTRVSSADLKS